jgi:tetratricopeptide (TPR) repeat protein
VHKIFISYSSKHRDLTRALAAAIEAEYGAGSVWWDHALEGWGDYEIQIRNALNEARVVVVIWTKAAGESDWVKSEAGRANRDGKLINVCPADTAWRDVPSPYDQHHMNSLEDTEGILRSIGTLLRGEQIPTTVPLHETYFRHHGDDHHQRRRLIDPKQSRLARDPHDISPTNLLQAKYAIVPYVDVTGIKADLLAWCRDGARTTAGRLVHGPGGLGKTRLMIEVAAALREGGWMAGFLDRPHGLPETVVQQRWQAFGDLVANGDDNGLLIVMDYAEARKDEIKAIAERLCRRPDHDTRQVRVVLLTRTAGEWWTTLHDETPDIQRLFRGDARGSGVIALQAIATPELFFASAQAMAPVLAAQGYANPTSQPSYDRLRRIERDADHARPLAVQREALLWLASAAPEAGPVGVDVLIQRVLGLESDHWGKLLGALDDDRKRDIARGLAQATVVLGTNSKPSTERLLMADRFYGDQRKARVAVNPVLRDLLRMYGKPDDGGVWQLEPDLIGEHHVAKTADCELIDGCLAWIDTEPTETREKHRRDLLTVLQRATHPDHGVAIAGGSALLDHLVGTRTRELASAMVAVTIETPGTLLHHLERHVDTLDEEALAAIATALPLHSLTLMEFSLQVAIRTADSARKNLEAAASAYDVSPHDHEELQSRLAGRLVTLGNRYHNAGQPEEALAAVQEAVNIFARLAATRPNAFLPALVLSLNNAVAVLAELGRHEEALAPSQEAVDIRRRLAAISPDAFLPDLAVSLNSFGATLSNLGRREEAAAAVQEAIDIYRRLAATQPDAFRPELAGSLNNAGPMLSNLGRLEEGLAASQEAVDIYRRLAAISPDAFLPDLASTSSQ